MTFDRKIRTFNALNRVNNDSGLPRKTFIKTPNIKFKKNWKFLSWITKDAANIQTIIHGHNIMQTF